MFFFCHFSPVALRKAKTLWSFGLLSAIGSRKGNNILIPICHPKHHNPLKSDCTLLGKNCASKGTYFPLRLDPTEEEGKIESGRIAWHESVPIHLKICLLLYDLVLDQ